MTLPPRLFLSFFFMIICFSPPFADVYFDAAADIAAFAAIFIFAAFIFLRRALLLITPRC